MAAVQDGHVVRARQLVDGAEEGAEARLIIDVLLAVSGQQHVAARL